jgi:hypothetical protein
LNPPAANDAPTPLLYSFCNFGEHGGVVLFDPLVEGGRARDEEEVGVFFHPVEGGTKGGFDFMEALLPLPKPDRVNVGVADHVEGFLFGIVFLVCHSGESLAWVRPEGEGKERMKEEG